MTLHLTETRSAVWCQRSGSPSWDLIQKIYISETAVGPEYRFYGEITMGTRLPIKPFGSNAAWSVSVLHDGG
jgi:hypothetical protein